jgi:hypothetical protein
MTTPQVLLPVERIMQAVHQIRHQSVLMDDDLAKRYGVEVRVLN